MRNVVLLIVTKLNNAIENLKASLNKKLPIRSRQEYRKDNKTDLYQKHKVFYTHNKERLKQYCVEYHQLNKERIREQKNTPCICVCGCANKIQHLKTKEVDFIGS